MTPLKHGLGKPTSLAVTSYSRALDKAGLSETPWRSMDMAHHLLTLAAGVTIGVAATIYLMCALAKHALEKALGK